MNFFCKLGLAKKDEEKIIDKEFPEDFLRAYVEGLLPIVTLHHNELDAVVFRHDVLLNKLILRATSELAETKLKVDLILNVLFQVHLQNTLRVHLEQCKDSLNNLSELLTVVDHLPRRPVKVLF